MTGLQQRQSEEEEEKKDSDGEKSAEDRRCQEQVFVDRIGPMLHRTGINPLSATIC